ncbi:MAG: hypothetical protein NC123_18315 [Butyrivibrio sp.]|nr:hypothetical protein [Acetatifactor muris]MCM1561467.1 hypothetical protein [Butyrivibrio sp.]
MGGVYAHGKMKIGLIDVDGHNFPNLPLMKLSAWHKSQGDSVKWYDPLFDSMGEPLDKVYMSKVFSFTPDYQYHVNAKEVIKGGSGYCISLENGKEVYHKENDSQLPYEVEHIYPDYSLYPELTKDTAYGFMSRGCPRGCDFCHVEAKEGRMAYKVADLSEFWRGQKNIVLLDPNPIACREWKDILDDFLNEGVILPPEEFNNPENAYMKARFEFARIWDATIKTSQVDLNPWVWVIRFKRCEKPEVDNA